MGERGPGPGEAEKPKIRFDGAGWQQQVGIPSEESQLSPGLKAKMEAIEQRATRDKLTGLPNRQAFEEWAQPRVQGVERSRDGRAVRRGDPETLHVAMVDVDKFKLVNDTRGHDVGDRVLQWIAAEMQSKVRGQTDMVARWGGEEFVIGLTGADDEKAAGLIDELRRHIAEASKAKVEEWGLTDRDELTASFGVAALDADCAGIEDAIKHADTALYEAKQTRNSTAVYTPDMQDKPEAA